ncbi:MFS transporter [Nocardia sp. NPDC050717]|uniref:MFS transporter n=1 Tax=Nocardia sp. NPDC050717 TaxID=3157221 RepID=UPI0033FDA585
MSTSIIEPSSARAGARQWLGLAVLALPTLLIAIDQSVLYLALPHLAEGLRPTGTQTLWIMDIYGFMIAGFLITMGTLGDRIGRRRLLHIGAVAVVLTSIAAAFAPSAEALILARALLGVAATTLMPSTLALISTLFRDPNQRAGAIAVWAGCFMGGTALGPVVSGVLLEHFWWGSVFLLGVPVMLVLLIAGPLVLPEYRDPAAGRIDLPSAALSLVAVLSLVFGVKEAARDGLGAGPVLAVVLGLGLGAVFVRRQRRLVSPLLDLRLFGIAAFTAALVIQLVSMFGNGGAYLFITGFLQFVHGLSPLTAGLWMIPAVLASILAAQLAPVLTRRFPPGAVLAAALLIGAVGYLLLTQVEPVGGLPVLIAGFVLIFTSVGAFSALGTNLVVGAVPPERSGSAAALASISGDLGIALGIATLGSLGSAVYTSAFDPPAGLPAEVTGTAATSIENASVAARSLPADIAGAVLDAARQAYTSGLNAVGLACAVAAALSTVIALTVLRARR